jgi:hypothetical protein
VLLEFYGFDNPVLRIGKGNTPSHVIPCPAFRAEEDYPVYFPGVFYGTDITGIGRNK